MNEMLNIGNGAFVNADKIKFIMQADADKVRRIMKRHNIDKTSDKYWDTVGDKEIKSFMVLDNGTVVVSMVNAHILAKRLNSNTNKEEKVNE